MIDPYPHTHPVKLLSSVIGVLTEAWALRQSSVSSHPLEPSVNLAIAEEGLDCSNAFAKTYFPDDDKAQVRQPYLIARHQEGAISVQR